MSGGGREPAEEERLRRVTTRAIRRLDVLEYSILAAAAVLALVAGWLVAWLLVAVTKLPFRGTWIVASVLFFVVPGAMTLWSNRKDAPSAGGGSRDEAESFDR